MPARKKTSKKSSPAKKRAGKKKSAKKRAGKKKTVKKPAKKLGAKQETTLEPLDLYLLLRQITWDCASGPFKYWTLLVPIRMEGERRFMGVSNDWVFSTSTPVGEDLMKWLVREFLKEFAGKSFEVQLDVVDGGEVLAFDDIGEGTVAERIQPVGDPEVLRLVEETTYKFLDELAPELEARERRKAKAKPGDPAWKSCYICSPIPETSTEFVTGGKLEGDALHVNEMYLHVVGEPFFNDDRGSRHWCLKRCPECGTCYLWEFDYEFLVGGSEDEVKFTRLSERDAEKWTKKVHDVIEESRANFEARFPELRQVLEGSDDPDLLMRAVDDIYYEQLVHGHDVRGLVPALVHMVARHHHERDGLDCPAGWAASVLNSFAAENPENERRLVEVLLETRPKVTSRGGEFEELWNTYKEKKR
ncbi:MAG: hypothetical protein ACTSU5_06455 [Promethearchaeota archaeon]